MHDDSDGFLSRLPGWAVMLIALAMLGLVMYLDFVTGTELSFSIFYMPAIMLVAWRVGRTEAVAVSLAASLCWLAADLAAGHAYSNRLIPWWNMSVRLGFFLVTGLLLAKVREQLVLARAMAYTDHLTGLANGRRFFDNLGMERARALRYSHPFTMAYIDLDNFKTVNDTLGHAAGDRLLAVFADGLRGGVRETDVAARVGGDEFALLLPETGFDAAGSMLSKLQANLSRKMQQNDWPVTVSMGAVTFEGFDEDIYTMTKIADGLMYDVKRKGKNSLIHELRGPRQTERS